VLYLFLREPERGNADRLARHMRGGRIVIQVLGLLLGAGCVATVGLCTTTPMLLAAAALIARRRG
jgi:hypothetical protein